MTKLVDGPASAATMLGFRTGYSGLCLMAVWQAYKRNGASTGMSSPTALDAYHKSGPAHLDSTPPDGVPVWWGARSWGQNAAAGDVVISVGGGRVVATDWPRVGVIGICTIEQRTAQIGRPYLGWTESIFDQAIDYPGREPEDMPVTDEEMNEIARKTARAVADIVIGEDTENSVKGRLGQVLGLTAGRAGKAATRSAQVLALLVSAEGDPDVAAIVEALKEALPAAVVDELKQRL